jgi:hypothetical protein
MNEKKKTAHAYAAASVDDTAGGTPRYSARKDGRQTEALQEQIGPCTQAGGARLSQNTKEELEEFYFAKPPRCGLPPVLALSDL